MSFVKRKRRRSKYRSKSRRGLQKFLHFKKAFEQKSTALNPVQKTTILPYSTVINAPASTVTSAASGLLHQYRVSSIYDPDYTAVGYQPYGHDQLAGVFQRYMVLKCDVEVHIPAQSYVLGTMPGYIGLLIGPLAVDQKADSNRFPSGTWFKDIVTQKLRGYKYCRVPVIGNGKTKTVLRASYDCRMIQNTVKGEYKDKLGYQFGVAPSSSSDPPLSDDTNIVASIYYHSATHDSNEFPKVSAIEVKFKYHVVAYDPKNADFS